MRRIPLLIVLLLALASMGSSAAAQTEDYVGAAVEALANDPIYVHPDADVSLSSSQIEDVRAAIATEGAGPVYIAILPDEARNAGGGDPYGVLLQIGEQLQRDGVYGVVVGRTFRAAASRNAGFAEGAVPALASDAAANADGQVTTLLTNFVGGLAEARAGAGLSDRTTGTPGGVGDGGRFSLLPLLLIGGLVFFGFRSMSRARRRRTEQAEQLEQVREVAEEDLTTLGNDIYELEKEFTMPGAHPEARGYYDEAIVAYQQARHAMDTARAPDQLSGATEAMEQGEYAVACARAILDGRPVPEHRAPCFFAPTHGPSSRDVSWAPPGGDPRPVPACEADAQRVERGEEPQTRHINVGGYSRPYYDAPAHYGGYYGGYYGGFGGLGFLQGMMLGQLFGGGWGFGGFGGGWGGGWGGGGGYGDFGGGDFGGGGFGGGGFGGGDFGGGFGGFGGDFGGGDF